MTAQQATAARSLGEMVALTNNIILMAALRGDAYRKLQRAGRLEAAIAETGSNDLEAHMLMALVDKLEELVRNGMEFVQALDWLRNAGWAEKVSHHSTI